MNSLPKTVTRQRRDCDSNPCSTEPESSTLITRLPSQQYCRFNKRPKAAQNAPRTLHAQDSLDVAVPEI